MRKHKRVKKMAGYIKLHRDIEHHWLWFDSQRLQWWIQLLFMAAWEPRQVTFGNETFTLQRGQIATTIRVLSKKFISCNQTVLTFLKVLENDKMIVKETNKKMTLITIVNYERYQQETSSATIPDATSKSASAPGSVERKMEHEVEQTKEIRKEEEQIKNNSQSLSRARDLEFIEEYYWCDKIARVLNIIK